MIPTLIILLAAHALADFGLQTGWIVRNKRKPWVLLIHIAIVVGCAAALAGSLAPLPLIALALIHLLIDLWKQFLTRQGFVAYLLDQAAHLASLVGIAALFPDFGVQGLWLAPPAGWPAPDPGLFLGGCILLAGLVFTVITPAWAIRLFMARFGEDALEAPGLAEGGFYIGLFERALIFFLALIGQITAIGFLIAAKSVLRVGVTAERKASEYVIIGTLMSFAWALVTGWLTARALGALPALALS